MHPNFQKAQNEIADTGRWLADKNWAPATSSNYSVKLSETEIAITRSGIDKSLMTPEDIIAVDEKGEMPKPLENTKPSAETLIHTKIYQMYPEANCVLHTHSALGTRLSMKFAKDHQISFSGYEVLKGLKNHQTHDTTEIIPIIPNGQDMVQFSKDLESVLNDYPEAHGFLIEGHGLYTWEKDIASCKRQVECFEFLFECKAYELMGV